MKRVKIKIIKTNGKYHSYNWDIYLIRVLSHKHYLKRKYNKSGYHLFDVENYIKLGFNR